MATAYKCDDCGEFMETRESPYISQMIPLGDNGLKVHVNLEIECDRDSTPDLCKKCITKILDEFIKIFVANLKAA